MVQSWSLSKPQEAQHWTAPASGPQEGSERKDQYSIYIDHGFGLPPRGAILSQRYCHCW